MSRNWLSACRLSVGKSFTMLMALGCFRAVDRSCVAWMILSVADKVGGGVVYEKNSTVSDTLSECVAGTYTL